MSLIKSQLLQKRVVCTGHEGHHFPGSSYLPGEILYYYTIGDAKGWFDKGGATDEFDTPIDVEHIENHPHLFRVLSWWESRTPDEMPGFVKRVSDAEVLAVTFWFSGNPDEWGLFYFLSQPTGTPRHASGYLPASQSDYESYILTLNNKP